ncbi:MATE family efflux transporter [Archangium gephyra]|uniref:MATE family efflux transporter n=1 Tax=Archangium gephyra TaxID=48 RepID=UPI003B766BAD
MQPPAPDTRPRTEFRELWKFAFPITLAHIGQSMMGFVDTAVLARAGTTMLAASALSNALLILVLSFGAGLMVGPDPLISQAFGAGDAARARGLVWQGGYVAAGAGTLLGLLVMGGAWLTPLLGLGSTEQAAVQDYLLWRAPGLPLMLLFINTATYLQASERPGVLVVSTVAANVLNLAADVVLVFGGAELPAFFGPLRAVPAMGAAGAALSTTFCTGLQWLIVTLALRRVPVPEGMPSRRPSRQDIQQILRMGFPLGLQCVADEGFHGLSALLARGLGPESIAAHQIAMSLCIFSFMISMGIGNAAGVRVGWAVGAGDRALARLRGQVAFVSVGVFMLCSGVIFALFPHTLARLIGTPSEVLPVLLPLLLVAALFQLSDGALAVGGGVLRGFGETRFTFYANTVGHYLVGLPVALLLAYGLGYGVLGIWWGLFAGLTTIAAALLWRFERLSSGSLQPLAAQA